MVETTGEGTPPEEVTPLEEETVSVTNPVVSTDKDDYSPGEDSSGHRLRLAAR